MKNKHIQAALIVHAYQNLPAMLFVNFAAALGAAVVFSAHDSAVAWYFFSAAFLLTIIRFIKLKQFQSEAVYLKEASAGKIKYWQRSYATLLCLTAMTWAMIGCFSILFAPGEIEYIILIIMSCLAGGATAVTAPLKHMGKLYITLLMLPVGIAFALNATMNYYILASLDLVFLIVMLMTQDKNHAVIKESYSLRSKNIALVSNLQDINNSLEATVENRTQELKDLAHKDTLTEIANRRGLMEWMDTNLNASVADDAAILFLDLDRFKAINDAKGHEVGDEILKMMTLRFRECCEGEFIMARWGGDEFVIVTKQSDSSHEDARKLATRLIDASSETFDVNGEELGLGVSIGSAFYPSDANSFKGVIHAADLAAAEVKRTGRGKLIAFDESYAEIQKKGFELSRALGEAIRKKELSIVYQPIINAKTGQIDSFEALARWYYDGRWVDPEEFISLAERTDRIITLGYWIFEQSCEQAALWLQAGHNQKVAVNVSVKQLLADGFVKRLIEILSSAKLPAKQLKLEVTESLFAGKHKDTIYDRVKQLKNLGIAIQIDDFGTGYSSLSRLHQFPISAIKIDQSFVMQIQNKGHTIIESALLIAQNFNLDVVAEGVETIEQASELHAMGVDYFQGYYFSKPSSELIFDDFDITWQSESDKALT